MKLFCLILLFVSLGAEAAPSKKLAGAAATKEGYERSCALSYAAFEEAVKGREKPVYDQMARIRARNTTFDAIDSADNKAFLRVARAANRGEPTRAKLFLDVENAVLKELNDKVIKNKDDVTALTNLHKDVLWQLSEDPVLKPHLVAQYSDFKSLRVALDTDSPAVRKSLEERLADLAPRYKNYLDKVAAKHDWTERGHGLSADIRNWFHGGLGGSPDQAGLAAKCSRSFLANGVATLRSFSMCAGRLKTSALNAGRYQAWAEKRFQGTPGFLVAAANGKKVLSAEAIEAFKKAVPKVPGPEAYFSALQEAAKLRFGLEISPKEAQALGRYMTFADQFSPGLLQEERVVIDMGEDAAGVISADFKGQNARNLEETMKALAETHGASLDEKVRAARAGEIAATEALERKKAIFQRAFARVFPGREAQFSGDDGIGFLPIALTTDQKKNFARIWKEEGGNPDDIRLTFEEFRYRDTGAPIPAEKRSDLVVEAEGLEKKLRAELIRDLPREDLNGLQIAVSLSGREKSPALASIYLASGKAPSPAVEARIKEIVKKYGAKLEAVEFTHLP